MAPKKRISKNMKFSPVRVHQAGSMPLIFGLLKRIAYSHVSMSLPLIIIIMRSFNYWTNSRVSQGRWFDSVENAEITISTDNALQ